MRLVSVYLLGLAACAFEPGGPGEPEDEGRPDPGLPADVDGSVPTTPDPPPPPPPPPMVDCRVERANLGVVGLRVTAEMRTYVVEAWQADSGVLVGFTLSGPDDVRYEVRTERDRYWSESMLWTVPGGRREAITRVDFCAEPDGPGPGGPGGGD